MAVKTRGKRKDYAAMATGGEVPEADTAAEQPQPKARRRKVRGPGAPEAAPSGAFEAPSPAAESDSGADQDTMPAIIIIIIIITGGSGQAIHGRRAVHG